MTNMSNLTAVELVSLFARRKLSSVGYFGWLEAHIAGWELPLQGPYRYRPDSGDRTTRRTLKKATRWRLDTIGSIDASSD